MRSQQEHEAQLDELRNRLARRLLEDDAREGARGPGGKVTFLCPAHEETEPSAWLGRRAWGCGSCAAGPKLKDLAALIGVPLPWEDRGLAPPPPPAHSRKQKPPRERPACNYTVEAYAADKQLPVEKLRKYGVTTGEWSDKRWARGPAVEIPYFREDGRTVCLRRYRCAGPGVKRAFGFPPRVEMHLYGLWILAKASSALPVIIVEGESDAQTLWVHRTLALGCPGTNAWEGSIANTSPATVESLRNRPLFVWREPAIGDAARGVAQFLLRVAETFPHVRVITPAGECKDASDLHLRDPDGFAVALKQLMDNARRVDDAMRAELQALVSRDAEPPAPPPADPPTANVPTSRADGFPFTDLGNAQRLIKAYGSDLRYCAAWGRWLVWDGQRWGVDETLEVQRRAQLTIRGLYDAAASMDDRKLARGLAGWALKSEAGSRLREMVTQAAALPDIAVAPAELDAHPWLLNVQNGMVDLRTGQLLPHDRATLLTKLAPVDYREGATAPNWTAFLARVLGDDKELQRFVRRAVGYALTAETSEHVLFFLYGTGANGKSTFIETVRDLMGDYGRPMEFRSLLRSNSEGPRNDLARLAGVRLVTASEVAGGKSLDEAVVKQLTGGDIITARFLHREYFDFRPAFKLFLAANHRPLIQGADHGIWRRIRLVPFTVTIPEDERDRGLGQRLRDEFPGILNWAVEGCLEWQAEGLGLPAAVMEATEDYQEDMDPVGNFLRDMCNVGIQDASTSASLLYQAYVGWANSWGERPLGSRTFGERLLEHGLQRIRKSDGKYYAGVRLKSTVYSAGAQSQAQATPAPPPAQAALHLRHPG